MTISKAAGFAAALILLVLASQAHAAPNDDAMTAYARSNTNIYGGAYRDPTTREALDEGA